MVCFLFSLCHCNREGVTVQYVNYFCTFYKSSIEKTKKNKGRSRVWDTVSTIRRVFLYIYIYIYFKMRFVSFKKPVNHYFHSMQYCPKRKKNPTVVTPDILWMFSMHLFPWVSFLISKNYPKLKQPAKITNSTQKRYNFIFIPSLIFKW